MSRKRPYKPSAAAIAMLENMATPGLSPTDGLRGRSAHGGAMATWTALYRHGLRDENGITAEGWAVIARARSERSGIAFSDISSLANCGAKAAAALLSNCNIKLELAK